MESHWIPDDPNLWKIENYEQFLSVRCILLAKAANELLDSLYYGKIAGVKTDDYSTKRYVDKQSEEDEIDSMSSWMASVGLDQGTVNHELLDGNGSVVAIIKVA